MFYSPSTGGFYSLKVHGSAIPGDAVEVSDEECTRLLKGETLGLVIAPAAGGFPRLQERPVTVPTATKLCAAVDAAADRAREAVAGDPLRAVEYDRARIEAEQFTAAGYQGDVPPMVAAWAIGGRTAQQAAESILAEAAQYTNALVQLRTVRLQAKELIRAAIAADNVEQAQDIAAETIASIEAAVAGIGNNASA